MKNTDHGHTESEETCRLCRETAKWVEPLFRLDVFIGRWKTVSRGLTQEKALEESKQFVRFKIIPEREGAL